MGTTISLPTSPTETSKKKMNDFKNHSSFSHSPTNRTESNNKMKRPPSDDKIVNSLCEALDDPKKSPFIKRIPSNTYKK